MGKLEQAREKKRIKKFKKRIRPFKYSNKELYKRLIQDYFCLMYGGFHYLNYDSPLLNKAFYELIFSKKRIKTKQIIIRYEREEFD